MKHFFIFIFIISCNTNLIIAQDNTVINYSDKAKIFDYQSGQIMPTIFNDYDNLEYLWLSIFNRNYDSLLLYKLDNNLNVEKIITNKDQLLNFKYNNKNYGISHTYSLPPNGIGGLSIDSVFIYCNDSVGNNIITKLIRSNEQDSFMYQVDFKNVFFSKEKNIVLFNYGGINNDRAITITVVDTLGNIKNFKKYIWPQSTYDFFFEEVDIIDYNSNYYGLVYVAPLIHGESKLTKLYYVDKSTLNIVDSNTFSNYFVPENVTRINDSIFVSLNHYGTYTLGELLYTKIDYFNINSLDVKTTKLYIGENEGHFNKSYIPEFGSKVDFINPDSIYYCYSAYNLEEGTNYIDIANFSVNGNINFRYRIDYDSTILFKQINGIKATTDGGLVIACTLYGNAWVIKFMPNGFVGLTDIETNEKASIKVYPNPSKDFIYVDIEADRFSSSEIELFDIQGRLVKKSKLNAQIGNRIDISNLSSGAYTYRVVINGKGISGKVIIGE